MIRVIGIVVIIIAVLVMAYIYGVGDQTVTR